MLIKQELRNEKPFVLITNDDGIESPGLHALVEALKPMADLLIAAPENQQTNMGRGALKGKAIGVIRRLALNVDGEMIPAYAVNGSPAQTVAHALLEIAERKPDYCISGINYGENLGLAFTCSGTLGAAFEADSFMIPSIAFSKTIPLKDQRSDEFSEMDWEMEKIHIQVIFNNILSKGMADNVRILNVNFPSGLTPETEVRVTKQAYMSYGKYVKPLKRSFEEGYCLEWELNEKLKEVPEDTDIYALYFDKVISVTPMSSLMSVDAKNYYK
jgi:5'-nucleotidase